ncbi:duf985 domain protein [Phlyctema vagabunda]|uniref:Duf985 domain protein n=1 Tax=Phlyctema vagabunda TaxID=108571 RepID=A0ABR4PMH7_9HELO
MGAAGPSLKGLPRLGLVGNQPLSTCVRVTVEVTVTPSRPIAYDDRAEMSSILYGSQVICRGDKLHFQLKFSAPFYSFLSTNACLLDSLKMPSASLPIEQTFPGSSEEEPAHIQSLLAALALQPNIEGGYYVETDRDPAIVPSPFPVKESNTSEIIPQRPGFDPKLRNASTTIYYLLTTSSPQGGFHRNAARTVHTLHRGRGQYVLIHADEPGKEKRIETFIVGQDTAKGERLQWIVEGGKYKASFLLPDDAAGASKDGLLISETVVPGFEFCDHDFLSAKDLKKLVGEEKNEELKWLLSPLAIK